MLKKLLHKLMFCGRVLVVILALTALCVSGAGAAQRIFAEPEAAEDTASQPDHNQLVPGPDPEGAPEGMADYGRPWTEPAACIQAPMLLVSNPHQFKGQPPLHLCNVASPRPAVLVTNSGLPATSCRVSWSLGRQFTLVGAKPSGTS